MRDPEAILESEPTGDVRLDYVLTRLSVGIVLLVIYGVIAAAIAGIAYGLAIGYIYLTGEPIVITENSHLFFFALAVVGLSLACWGFSEEIQEGFNEYKEQHGGAQ